MRDRLETAAEVPGCDNRSRLLVPLRHLPLSGDLAGRRRTDRLFDKPALGLRKGGEEAQVEVGRGRDTPAEVRRSTDDDKVDGGGGAERFSRRLWRRPDEGAVVTSDSGLRLEADLLLSTRKVRVDNPKNLQASTKRPARARGQQSREERGKRGRSYLSSRLEWFQGPSGEPKLISPAPT